MASDDTAIWQELLAEAYAIVDAAEQLGGGIQIPWAVGGGTMLMRRYSHRLSKDVDVFVDDSQYLGFFTPRLNSDAEIRCNDYVEQSGFVKLYFDRGEIDFVFAPPLTDSPTVEEKVLGRVIAVETDAEIIAKKVKYRGASFKARDLFDLACVVEKNPAGLSGSVSTHLVSGRDAVLERLRSHGEVLEEDFAAIAMLDYTPSYEHCARVAREFLEGL